jgi:photosystem II PsbY protein
MPNWPGSTPTGAADCCIFDQLFILVVGFSGIVAYSAYSVITTGQVLGIDARLFLVVAPILAAVSWAAFNIGRAAVGQLQLLIKRSRA